SKFITRFTIFAVLVAAISACVVAGSAVAANGNSNASVIYDSTAANGAPTNQVSLGGQAYQFNSIGDQIKLAGNARSLTNVTVTLSSWACQQGAWFDKNCVTKPGATFSLPITLSVWNENHTKQLASKTQTFDVPYRPSDSAKCNFDGWYTPSKECKHGLADD